MSQTNHDDAQILLEINNLMARKTYYISMLSELDKEIETRMWRLSSWPLSDRRAHIYRPDIIDILGPEEVPW